MRVLLYDRTDRLTPFWAAGRVLSRWDAVVAAASWADAVEQLEKLPHPVLHLQFWGHGTSGAPLIDGVPLGCGAGLDAFVAACRFTPRSVAWWRACNVFQGEAGHRFAVRFCEVAGCGHAGHTRIVSAPWPIFQSGGHALRPGHPPHWSVTEGDEDKGGSGPRKPNTCLVTRMTIPPDWWTT